MAEISVTFIDPAGAQRPVRAPVGDSLMRAAVQNGIDGILGDCGGCATCATCHVYVDLDWTARVGPPGEEEACALEMSVDVGSRSRLACQVALAPALDGLIVHIPARQF